MNKVLIASIVGICSFTAGQSQASYPPGFLALPSGDSLLQPNILYSGPTLSSSPFLTGNVQWPTEIEIAKKQIFDKASHEREIERTWFWMSEVAKPYLHNELKDNLILMPGMKNGDDWVMLRYESYCLKIQIIDGRTMTIVVKPNDPNKFLHVMSNQTRRQGRGLLHINPQPPEWMREQQILAARSRAKASVPPTKLSPTDASAAIQKECELFATNLFKELINYENTSLTAKQNEVIAEEVHRDPVNQNAFYGKFGFGTEKLQRRLIGDMNWWSDGRTVVIDIDKLIKLYELKGLEPIGKRNIGGIPVNDERRFTRFDSENSIDFQKEFLRRKAEFPRSNQSTELKATATPGPGQAETAKPIRFNNEFFRDSPDSMPINRELSESEKKFNRIVK